ncbi:Hsp20/alpha crystallin family protein [Paraburkholderia sp. EG286B]|uniref:Hsp20/alpha crystallin family protein n=1 Tax=Paraburkholderia sp. EG286B TaxID=3237011 RepID=UPI0034D1EEB4
MSPDPKRWNPFKFLRAASRKSDARGPETPPPASESEPLRTSLPDIARLFTREPWRAVEEFFLDPLTGRVALDRWFGDFSSSRFQPRIDVVDEGPVLRVTAELPGVDREDLQASVEDGAIVLRGEKKQDVRSEENGCYRLERAHGRFVRTIPMPEYADPGRALAKFDNGVLTLTIPKMEPAPCASRTIDIG